MSADVEQVTQDALALTERERAHLAHTLLLSLDRPSDESEVQGAWENEVAWRVQEIQEGRATSRPAEDVLRDIRARHER
jgi:hypothetical protein